MGSERVGDWQCPNTACINHTQYPKSFVFGSKVNCPKCGTGKTATRPNDWCCPNPSCVNHQNTVYGSKSNCSRCGAERPALNARGSAMPNASPHMVGSLDGGAPSVGRGGVPLPRVGDWHCPNPTCKNYKDNLVFASKDFCPICGTEKPAPPPGAPGPSGPIMPAPQQGPRGPPDLRGFGGGMGGCHGCGTGGFGMGGMGGFGGKGGGGGLGPGGVSPVRPGDWHCSNPTCKNHTDNVVFSSKSSCPICGMPKPEDHEVIKPVMSAAPRVLPPPPMGGMMGPYGGHGGPGGGKGGPRGQGQPGDWHCSNPTCKNHTDNVVYASKMICPICGNPKPSAGVLVSSTCRPGDWQCPNPSCKNHVNGVYASKAICNLCGSPNPGDGRTRSRSPRTA